MSSQSMCPVACSWLDLGSFHTLCLESCTWSVVIFTMDQRKEQQVRIKFCANLGRVLRRPLQWFNKPSGTKAWGVRRCFNGMPSSRPVAHQLTMTNTQGDPEAAQLLKMLHEFKSLSIRIDVRPFTTLLRRWELVMGHTNGFSDRRIWHAPCRNQICALDPDSWPEAAVHQCLHWTSSAHLRWWNLLVQGHHWRWQLGLQLRSWKKATILPVEKPHITKAKKKPDRWKAMSRGLCTKNLSQQAKLWIPGSTATFCGNCVKTCEDVTPNFGEKRPGCFTMTTPHLTLLSSRSSFWWKTKWLSSPTHHTPLIWHLVTSSYFQKRNWSWKDAGLIPIESQRVFDTLVEKDFQEAFQKWRRRWDRYLHAGGNYFKGDSSRQALWWVLWFLQHQSGKFWIPPRIANLNQINHIRLARGVLTNMWIAMHNSMYWLWKPFHSRYKKTEANSHSGSQDPTF